MGKDTLLNREIDLVLLSLEMTKQAHHVKRCWSIIKQIQQARKDYPNEINISLGFYRTVFDSLVTSVFIGLGKLYDQDGDTYSLYSLRTLIGSSFTKKEDCPLALKEYSQKLSKLSSTTNALRQWRNKQYAHNAQELGWDQEKLNNQWPLNDEDIELLIQFACEYCDFFSMLFIETTISDNLPPCDDLENTLQKLHSYSAK